MEFNIEFNVEFDMEFDMDNNEAMNMQFPFDFHNLNNFHVENAITPPLFLIDSVRRRQRITLSLMANYYGDHGMMSTDEVRNSFSHP